jgi:hypothetical protein
VVKVFGGEVWSLKNGSMNKLESASVGSLVVMCGAVRFRPGLGW